MPIYRSEFAGCCGLGIIYGIKYNYPEGVKLTEERKADLKAEIDRSRKANSSIGMSLVAINNVQEKDGAGQVLEECGFKLLTRPFYHPGHRHRIYLYGYENYPDKAITDDPRMVTPIVVEPEPPKKEAAPRLFGEEPVAVKRSTSLVARRRVIKKKVLST